MRARGLRRISVDLTPLVPGGDNGGAKVLAKALVRELSQLAPDIDFTLLTSSAGHLDVADLDAPNVRRVCPELDSRLIPGESAAHGVGVAQMLVRKTIDRVLSPAAATRVKDHVWTVIKRRRRATATRSVPADLIFCPFTAPYFFDPSTPLVSIVHDLQYQEYPEFFSAQQRQDRGHDFLDACRRADVLICVSDFVRQTVLATGQISPERVRTVHSALLRPAQPAPLAESLAAEVLRREGVHLPRFLLYPANAWAHKNHRALLEAFAIYRGRAPHSDLALMCTGAASTVTDELKALAERLLPPGTFAFTGYVTDAELAVLLQTCRALIFPSLYEGFGLPVLEAMAYQRPVLCSNVTSLPEIAGDAAILFDPRDPSAIAEALVRLETEVGLEAQLVARGQVRAARFGTARQLAERYLATFEEAALLGDKRGPR